MGLGLSTVKSINLHLRFSPGTCGIEAIVYLGSFGHCAYTIDLECDVDYVRAGGLWERVYGLPRVRNILYRIVKLQQLLTLSMVQLRSAGCS